MKYQEIRETVLAAIKQSNALGLIHGTSGNISMRDPKENVVAITPSGRDYDTMKAEDITIIDISEVSVLADYFIIADGSNRNQVQAMADSAEEALGRAGYDAKQIEGYQSANWILMDYGDLIIHVFDEENRLFYDLERIWRDGKELDVSEFLK